MARIVPINIPLSTPAVKIEKRTIKHVRRRRRI